MKRFLFLILIVLSLGCGFASGDVFNEANSSFARINIPDVPDGAVYLTPGEYSVPEDIPVGNYQIDTDSFGCDFHFSLPENGNIFSCYFGRNFGRTRIGHIYFPDGSSLAIEKNGVYLSPSSFSFPTEETFSLLPGLYFPGDDLPVGSFSFSQADNALPARVITHDRKKHGSTHYQGDIGTETKIDLSGSIYLVIYDAPVNVRKYVSPFYK